MPPKQLFRSEARARLLRGATGLADAIRITLGPRSKSVLIAKQWGRPARAGVLSAASSAWMLARLIEIRRAHRRVGACELEIAGSLDAAHDLLGGSSRYKMSLATASAPLAWLRVQHVRLRFAIEDRLRVWKHADAGALA